MKSLFKGLAPLVIVIFVFGSGFIAGRRFQTKDADLNLAAKDFTFNSENRLFDASFKLKPGLLEERASEETIKIMRQFCFVLNGSLISLISNDSKLLQGLSSVLDDFARASLDYLKKQKTSPNFPAEKERPTNNRTKITASL